jgi:hypothetical protein
MLSKAVITQEIKLWKRIAYKERKVFILVFYCSDA